MSTTDAPKRGRGRPRKTAAPAAAPTTPAPELRITDYGKSSAGERIALGEDVDGVLSEGSFEDGIEQVDGEPEAPGDPVSTREAREGVMDLSGPDDGFRPQGLLPDQFGSDGRPVRVAPGTLKPPPQPIEHAAAIAQASWNKRDGLTAYNGSADMPRDDRDDLTRMVGANYFEIAARFDWCRTYDGRRHDFTRYYFQQAGFPYRMLLDIFASDSKIVREEVAEKTAAIQAFNAQNPDGPIGYIPAIRGAMIDPEVIEQARVGGIYSIVGAVRDEVLSLQ